MSDATSYPPHVWDYLFGSTFTGVLFASALWGMTCMQVFTFYSRSEKDRLYLKIIVGYLWCLDTFNTFLNAHQVYHYLVTNYANPAAAVEIVWSWALGTTFSGIMTTSIRCLFAHRVYLLSKNVLLVVWIVVISLVDLSLGIVITTKLFRFGNVSGLSQSTHHIGDIMGIVYANFASSIVADFSVAAPLCWYLYVSRSNALARTNSLLKILMIYTVNTGLLVSLFAIVGLICTTVARQTNFGEMIFMPMSKLYVNSYIALLNERSHLRERSDDPLSMNLSHLVTAPNLGETVDTNTTRASVPDVEKV